MNNNVVRYGLAAAAVILVVIVGINLIGPNVGGPPEATPTPTATPSSEPTPSQAPSPVALPSGIGTPLDAGTYSLPSFPVEVTFDIPATEASAHWAACSESNVEQAVCYFPSGDEFAGQLAFLIVTNVAADPCSPGEILLDPPVAPVVDAVVSAIADLEDFGYEVTQDGSISVDGYGGQQLTVTSPTDSACEGFAPWATEDRTTGMGPGETNVLWIIDGGVPVVMIAVAADPESPHAAAFDEVRDSVHIGP
jgi:hypothetical protein